MPVLRCQRTDGSEIDVEMTDLGLRDGFYESLYRWDGNEVRSRVDKDLIDLNGSGAQFRMCEDLAMLEAAGLTPVRL